MTKSQNVLVELLQEIDGFCKAADLHYFLGGEVGISAFRCGHFESETTIMNIFMTLPDILRLQTMIQEKNDKDRVLESVYNNDYYPDISFRYCNKNTLCLSLKKDTGIKAPGLCVNIKVLRKFPQGRTGRRAIFLEHGWYYNYVDYTDTPLLSEEEKQVKEKAAAMLARSREKYKNDMIKCLERSQRNVSLGEELYYLNYKFEEKTFPRNLFCEQQTVSLEGYTFTIPKQAAKFFRVLQGGKWKTKEFVRREWGDSKIIDPDLPYEVYLSQIDREKAFSQYREAKETELIAKATLKELNDKLNQEWYRVIRSGDRLNLWEKYMPQKESLVRLYAEEKWDELKDLFEDYDTEVRKNFERGLGLCFDAELFEIYRNMLCHFDEAEFAEQCLALVPQSHLQPIELSD